MADDKVGAEREYTVYEDDNGEEFIVVNDETPVNDDDTDRAGVQDDEAYEEEQEENDTEVDDTEADDTETDDNQPRYDYPDYNNHENGSPDDYPQSRDPEPFDEDEYNRINPMNISVSGAQPGPVEPYYEIEQQSQYRDPTPQFIPSPPRDPTPQFIPPPPRDPSPLPQQSRRHVYRDTRREPEPEEPQMVPYQQSTSPPQHRKQAKGYLKGGVLIVDGGHWEAKARVDHVNKHYHPSGGEIEIFNDKLKWNGQPRIDTKQKDYKRTGGDKQIFHERQQWKASPRIDTDNKQHMPGGGDVVILHERLKWHRRPMVDTRNVDYSPAKGNFEMFEERPDWQADARVNASNKGYKPSVGNAVIIDEKPKWKKNAKVDHVKPFYKPGGGNIRVVSHNVKWDAGSKVDALNDNYVPAEGNIQILNERLDWNAQPRVEAKNPFYKKGGGKVKISSMNMDWVQNSRAKVETLNKFYEYEPAADNVEFDAKTKRWVARGRTMRRPATGQSLDSQLAIVDANNQNKGNAQLKPINRAPAGTSYTQHATSRKPEGGYGGRFLQKRLNGPPLQLPPIETAQSLDNKKVLFKSTDLVTFTQSDKKPTKTDNSFRKTFKGKDKKLHSDAVPIRYRSVTPDFMYRQNAQQKEQQLQKKEEQKNKPTIKKQRIEHINMKNLENKNKDTNKAKQVFHPDYSNSSTPVYTPANSSFNDYPDLTGVPDKGYNAHRRDRQYLKDHNKYAATDGIYHIPHRKRADKVYS